MYNVQFVHTSYMPITLFVTRRERSPVTEIPLFYLNPPNPFTTQIWVAGKTKFSHRYFPPFWINNKEICRCVLE